MKTLSQFIIENLIFEYERDLVVNNMFTAQIGNHADIRKQRGLTTNFKINFTKINDTKIINLIKKFNNAILGKISNNTLTVNDFKKSIKLIDYNITIAIVLKGITEDGKYILSITSVWPTDDDYGTYEEKYKRNKIKKDNTEIYISDIK